MNPKNILNKFPLKNESHISLTFINKISFLHSNFILQTTFYSFMKRDTSGILMSKEIEKLINTNIIHYICIYFNTIHSIHPIYSWIEI
jgi:hypothetical protein